MSIAFGGDVMLDGGPGHALEYGLDPFAEFADFLKSADVSVCNLECVVAPGGKQAMKAYTFRASDKSVPVLKQHFHVVSVANNHTGDFGPKAFLSQLKLLEAGGLKVIGGGRNLTEARRPAILERHGRKIALLAYNGFPPSSFTATERRAGSAWFDEAHMVEDVKAAKAAGADIVIPYIHWGNENRPDPNKEQRHLARCLIDAGASAVIGAHPHVTQTVDIYRGRPIVYSLGNFVFDYFPGDPELWTGWLVKLTFSDSETPDMESVGFSLDRTGIPRRVIQKD